MWGCDGRPQDSEVKLLDGTPFDLPRCPRRYASKLSWTLLQAYSIFDAYHRTPIEGGWLDQSNLFTEAIIYAGGLRAQIDERIRKRERKNG